MRQLETIHLRLAGDHPLGLVERIRRSIGASGDQPSARIYRHATVAGDLAIQIYLETADRAAQPSQLGLRLTEALKAYGLVEHSVWTEVP